MYCYYKYLIIKNIHLHEVRTNLVQIEKYRTNRLKSQLRAESAF